jgi:2-polyprenyl-6-methoxyphenol hydroxylase-like FAD-dependent oxidoreductase
LVLIGDARHAMHPARSMGMNTCFRVADQLADSLTCLNSGFSEAEVLPLLSEFETRFEQELTPAIGGKSRRGIADGYDHRGRLRRAKRATPVGGRR